MRVISLAFGGFLMLVFALVLLKGLGGILFALLLFAFPVSFFVGILVLAYLIGK